MKKTKFLIALGVLVLCPVVTWAIIQPEQPYWCKLGHTSLVQRSADATTGNKRLLFIRVNYSNDPTEPQTLSSAQAMMSQVNDKLRELSYGQLSITTTFTSLVTLPKQKWDYLPPYHDEDTLRKNATARAEAADPAWNHDLFDFFIVRYQDGPGTFAFKANVGSKEVLLKVSDASVAVHGLLHNLGLWHANHWHVSDGTTLGPGDNVERGDPFDAMSVIPAHPAGSINAYARNRLHWMPDSTVTTVTTGGTYRIFTLDQPVLDSTKKYAIKIQKDTERAFWLGLRQKFTGNSSLMNGVELHWSPWSQSNNGTQLLDAHPGGSLQDAPIAIGEAFTDSASGITIKPIGKAGTTPESMDVEISFANSAKLVANAGPNQTVTDSDGNGVQSLTLNGSASTGAISSYVWRTGSTQIATGTSPTVNLGVGTHTVTLMVVGPSGANSVDNVMITVNAGAQANKLPVANAGANITVTDSDGNGYETVSLNGTGSYDPDGTIVSYAWRGGDTGVGIGGSATVALSIAVGGPHTITLLVTDNKGASAMDTVVVTVNPSGGIKPPAAPGSLNVVAAP